MSAPRVVVCTVTLTDQYACVCIECGWQLPNVASAEECGRQWDAHVAASHR